MMLPAEYKWLEKELAPKILLEALKLYGVEEFKGDKHNPEILGWAEEVGLEKVYLNDEIAWCGLFAAIVVHRAGKPVVKDPLWARNWANWGEHCEPHLGCIMVFSRGEKSGHVGIYIGEDDYSYYVYGGNQGDKVSITRISKDRLIDSRAIYTTAMPANCRKVVLTAHGELSTNEA